jgi:hypothetical protein
MFLGDLNLDLLSDTCTNQYNSSPFRHYWSTFTYTSLRTHFISISIYNDNHGNYQNVMSF